MLKRKPTMMIVMILVIFILSAMVAGCTNRDMERYIIDEETKVPIDQENTDTDYSKNVVEMGKDDYVPASENDNAKFSFKVFSELMKSKEGENVFISPTSISTALLLAYNGAEGATKAEIEKVLELNSSDLEQINKNTYDFITRINKNNSKVKINIANSVWVRDDEKILNDVVFENYREKVKNSLLAEVEALDFNNSSDSAKTINNWVDSKTNHKIPEIIGQDQIDQYLQMVLINAIYFNGEWQNQFNEEFTKKEDFFTDSGKTKCDMMRQQERFDYYGDENLQLIKLPYALEQQSMYVLLPAKGYKLDNFLKVANEKIFAGLLNKMEYKEGIVKLPKFKVECTYNKFADVLENIGLNIACSDQADFSSISSKVSMKIDEVIHKTFIDVDENGTEAAAVTAIMMKDTCALEFDPPKPFEMTVDRPFFFVIRDDISGNLLFMGAINEL